MYALLLLTVQWTSEIVVAIALFIVLTKENAAILHVVADLKEKMQTINFVRLLSQLTFFYHIRTVFPNP